MPLPFCSGLFLYLCQLLSAATSHPLYPTGLCCSPTDLSFSQHTRWICPAGRLHWRLGASCQEPPAPSLGIRGFFSFCGHSSNAPLKRDLPWNLKSIPLYQEVLEGLSLPLCLPSTPPLLLRSGRLIFRGKSGLLGPQATGWIWPLDVLAGSRGREGCGSDYWCPAPSMLGVPGSLWTCPHLRK